MRERFSSFGSAALGTVPEGAKIAVIHAEYLRSHWEGRGVPPAVFKDLLQSLRAQGHFLILLGGENPSADYSGLAPLCDLNLCGLKDFRELLGIFCRASLFVGIDSGPLHFAQLLGVPSFVIFGATLPSARLLDPVKSYGYVHPELECIGCYHEKVGPGDNYCMRRDEACVKKLDPAALRTSFESFLAGNARCDARLVDRERRLFSMRTEAKLQTGGSVEDYRLRELAPALGRKLLRALRDRAPGKQPGS